MSRGLWWSQMWTRSQSGPGKSSSRRWSKLTMLRRSRTCCVRTCLGKGNVDAQQPWLDTARGLFEDHHCLWHLKPMITKPMRYHSPVCHQGWGSLCSLELRTFYEIGCNNKLLRCNTTCPVYNNNLCKCSSFQTSDCNISQRLLNIDIL